MSDRVEESGYIVDVFSRRIFKGVVKIASGRIVDIIEKDVKSEKYIMPGFVDSHVHIESSMLIPVQFSELAVKHGTVAVIADPHEIANVMGVKGFEFMLENANMSPLKFYFGVPSCVPATGFETSGAYLGVSDVDKLLAKPEVKSLSEMMNVPGVLFKDKEVLGKLEAAKKYNKPIDGHAPGLSGNDLRKYIASGISTDHECITVNEAIEKLKLGMKVQIREGSAAKNFDELSELIPDYADDLMFCTDDVHPDDLKLGHINAFVKKGLKKDYSVFDLIQIATVNPVKHYKLDVGLLQKKDSADFIIVDNLDDFNIEKTYISGVEVQNEIIEENADYSEINNFKLKEITKESLLVQSRVGELNVISCKDGSLVTKNIQIIPKITDNLIVSDIEKDILKIVVINRYQENSKPTIGFIHNFGLKKGAIASTIAHDSHNVIAVGVNDDDIVSAVNEIIKTKGGISVCNGNEIDILPLEVAGLMTSKNADSVADKYSELNQKARDLGGNLTNPFMTLSFMALLVIPEFKISDKGLFNSNKFQFTDLFVDNN